MVRRMMLAAGLLAMASAAAATPTKIGQFMVTMPGTDTTQEPILGGTATDTKIKFKSGGAKPISGTIQVRLVRNDRSGEITFYYRIVNDRESAGPVSRMFLRHFPNLVYDANWLNGGSGTVAPAYLSGVQGKNGDGYFYTWDFGSGIKPGESSRFVFLRSHAKATVTTPATVYVYGAGVVSAETPVPSPAP